MKSRTLCAFLIAILLISPVAFGEIIEIGDWDGNCGGNWYSSTPSAHATGDDHRDYNWGDGWNYTYTTEEGNFHFNYYVYTYAEAHLYLYDNETCYAMAFADASARAGSSAHSLYALVDLEDSGEYGEHVWDYDNDDTYPSGKYVQGYGWFDPYPPEQSGVSADHMAIAYAWVPEDSDCTAHSHGCTQAWGSMFD